MSSENIVLIAPGQTVAILRPELGDRVVQQFTYDEILAALVKKSRLGKSRASKTPERVASRAIGLLGRAILTGKWATGAEIDKGVAFDKLIRVVESVPNKDLLTPNAKNIITSVQSISLRTSDIENLSGRQVQLHRAFCGESA